jgi:gluconokinase
MDFILTLDLGTTHIKAQLIDPDLNLIDEESARVTTNNPGDLFQEQDPEEVRMLSESVLSNLISRCEISQLRAMVFSNAMHSIIPVDENGKALNAAIIWSDLRAGKIADSIRKTVLGTQLYVDTGTPIHAMSPLFKIMWLKEHEKEIFEQTSKFLSIKDYLIFHWFGVYKTDYSTASASGLFNISSLDWSTQSLELASIQKSMLPDCNEIYHNVNNGNSEFLNGLGISKTMPVLLGATDGCLAVVGGGRENLKEFALSIGTSSAIRTVKENPIADPDGRIFNYYLDHDMYISGGPSNNGGNLLEWGLGNFFPEGSSSPADTWSSILETTQPCSDGLIFLPYIFGERAPLWDATSTGSYHGIKPHHTIKDFLRSILEGILMNLRTVAELVDTQNENQKLILSGGVFNIPGLPQLVADIFDKKIEILDNTNLSSNGAAIIGWRHLGITPNELNNQSIVLDPKRDQADRYSNHFIKFKNLLNTYHQ